MQGKVAIVTGASRGIGRVIAQSLAQKGSKIIAIARSMDNLSKTCQLIEDKGGQATLKIRQGYLIDEDAVKGLHKESPTQPGNNRHEVFILEADEVCHH